MNKNIFWEKAFIAALTGITANPQHACTKEWDIVEQAGRIADTAIREFEARELHKKGERYA
jgi:hypothetical protein